MIGLLDEYEKKYMCSKVTDYFAASKNARRLATWKYVYRLPLSLKVKIGRTSSKQKWNGNKRVLDKCFKPVDIHTMDDILYPAKLFVGNQP